MTAVLRSRVTPERINHIETALSFRALDPTLVEQIRVCLPDMTQSDADTVLDLINAHPKVKEYQP